MSSVLATVGLTDIPHQEARPAARITSTGAVAPVAVLAVRERNGLIALVVGLHVALLLWIAFRPLPALELTPPDVPEMTIEFSSPSPARPVEPPPPPPPRPVTPPPVVRTAPAPVVDELASKPAPPKPVVQAPPPSPVAAVPTPPVPATKVAAPAPVTPPLAYADYLRNPAPEYPEQAVRRNWEGTVLLRVHVLASGRPSTIDIERSSGREVLDRAAVKTVQKWTFVPAKRGNEPQDGWVTVPIDFKLQ